MTVVAVPEYLRTGVMLGDSRVGVDETAQVVRGFVVAELGEFKDKRGFFNEESLNKIVELGRAAGERGLRSRLSHPNESDDGLTKHLGRVKNFRLDGNRVRADLHLADVAMSEPIGGGKPLGRYVMDLATEDPGALGSSLVLKSEKLDRKDAEGQPLPPHWMPTQLFASDIVSDGDAVHGDLLSVDALDEFMEGSGRRIPTKLAIAGAQYLDQLFPESERDVIAERIDGFKRRYLARRFGGEDGEEGRQVSGDRLQEETPSPAETATSPASGRGERNFEETHLNHKELEMDEATQAALAEQSKRIDELSKSQTEKIDKLTALLTGDIESRAKERTQKDRAAEIAALCKQVGNKDAEQFIADDSLSVEDVMRKLIAGKSVAHEGLGGSGENDRTSNPLEKLRGEFDAKKEHLTKVGYKDRETWVRHQCRDRGIEYEK